MKKLAKNVFLISSVCMFAACEVLEDAATKFPTATSAPVLSNGEVISGLKEALQIGIKNSVNLTSVTDGFFKNRL